MRILLVEDEIMVAMLVEDMLLELGHEVVGPANRLDRAIEAARREMIDGAVLDVNLDGREVYPVAEALVTRNIPFVFATGYGSRGLRESWRDRPVLMKPFQKHELDRAVAALSRTARSGT